MPVKVRKVKGVRTTDSASREGGVLLRLTMRACKMLVVKSFQCFSEIYFNIIFCFLQTIKICFLKKRPASADGKENNNPFYSTGECRAYCVCISLFATGMYVGQELRCSIEDKRLSFNITVDFFCFSYRTMKANFIVAKTYHNCNNKIDIFSYLS